MEFEKIRDEVENRLRKAFYRSGVHNKKLDPETFSKRELWNAVREVCNGYDHGATNYEIQREIDRVAESARKENGKEKAARKFLTAILSRGYYGYCKLRKMLGWPVESPTFRWWNWRVAHPVIGWINPGGKVFIRCGGYTMDDTLVVKPKVAVEGENRRYVILTAKNSLNANMIANESFNDDTDVYDEGVRLEKLYLQGNKANQTSGKGICLRTSGAVLEDMAVYQAKEEGLWLQGKSNNSKCMENQINRCDFRQCDGAGISIRGFSPDNRFINSFIWNNGSHGVLILTAGQNFDQCRIETNDGSGVYCYQYENWFDGCKVAGNMNDGYHFFANATGHNPIKNVITGGLIFGNSENGVVFQGKSTPAIPCTDNLVAAVSIYGHDTAGKYGVLESGVNEDRNFIVVCRFKDNDSDVSLSGSNSKVVKPLGDYVNVNNVLSGTFDITAPGLKSVTVTHGCGYTPAAQDIQVTIVEDTNAGEDWWAYVVKVRDIGSTTFVVDVYVADETATGGATAKLSCRIAAN